MLDSPETDISPLDIRRSAMDLLAFREHSMYELVNKLARKFPHCLFIETELERLAEDNLQSDERFAEAFVRSKINKGHGPLRIRNELKERGVASRLISQALEQSDVDWLAVIKDLSLRKYGDSPAQDYKEQAKRTRFFQYRGFSYEYIKQLDSAIG